MSSSVLLSGTSAFIAGKIFAKYILNPYVTFKEHLSRISALLVKEQENIMSGHVDESLLHELREASALLMAKHNAVPVWFSMGAAKMHWIPARANIVDSAQHLNFIISPPLGQTSYSCCQPPPAKSTGVSISI